MSDTVVVMDGGKIQQIGTPEDIYNEPKNAFVADFIGESNIIDGIMRADQVVEPAEIRYLESRLHVVRVHAARGVLEVYGKLSDLLDALPARFVRCHQSFAVNLDAVTSLDASSITLVSGEQVPVSRRMRAEVRAALFAHLRARRR